MKLQDFELHRDRLMAIAYRMLGSTTDAEDILQEAWIRWQRVDRNSIVTPRAWLCTTVTRLCLDRLKSASARREAYPGTWLPEPAITPSPIDAESITLGFLILLEQLTPTERAVFLLHRVFDYSHKEIAATLGTSVAASRKLLQRAKQHVEAAAPRFEANPNTQQRLLRDFAKALEQGDTTAIRQTLADDAALFVDSGGKVPGAARRPIAGGAKIARFLAGLARKSSVVPSLSIEDINGWSALVARVDEDTFFVMSVETDETHITSIRNVINPDKLSLRRVD